MDRILGGIIPRINDELKDALAKCLTESGDKKTSYNSERYAIVKNTLEKYFAEFPLLKKLYDEKMINIIYQKTRIVIFFLPYSSLGGINRLKPFNENPGVSFVDLLRPSGGSMDINMILLDHYIKSLEDPNHPMRIELQRIAIEEGRSNFALETLEALKTLKRNTGRVSELKNRQSLTTLVKELGLDMSVFKAYSEGLLPNEKATVLFKGLHIATEDIYKISEAIKLAMYFDYIYKGKNSIGKLAKEMINTSYKNNVGEYSEEVKETLSAYLDEFSVSELFGPEYMLGTSTIVGWKMKVPSIKNLDDSTDVLVSELNLKGPGNMLSLRTEENIKQFLEIKIMLPSIFLAGKDIVVNDVMNSNVAKLMKDAVLSWRAINEFEKLTRIMGTKEAYEKVFGEKYSYKPTKIKKQNWFTNWIKVFAGYSFMDPNTNV